MHRWIYLLGLLFLQLHICFADEEEGTKDFPKCRGDNQSPVMLPRNLETLDSGEKKNEGLYFEMTPIDICEGTFMNTGYTVNLTCEKTEPDDTPSVILKEREGNTNYFLKYILFHWPSEHTLAGKRFDLEIQLVHTDAKGDQTLIISSLVAEDSGSEQDLIDLKEFTDNFPVNPGDNSLRAVNVKKFAPDLPNYEFYAYLGSFTTPPCSEGVMWLIYIENVTPKEQINIFKTAKDGSGNEIKNNARTEQPLGDREVFSVAFF